tara:strand:+ start:314 stop:1150 length:837 start_codon:yes stop_codon:yes gene_type:complete
MNKITNRFKQPLVSVIIPTFNSESTIYRCINSVIDQTYSSIEIIIIDDCSTDETLKKIYEMNLQNVLIIKNDKNQGPSKCRNDGILACSGKYVSILDSDDFIFQSKIEKQIDFLENNKKYSVIGTNVIIKKSNDANEILSKRKNSHEEIIKSIFYYNPFCHSSIIFKKKDFLLTEMYNEKIFFGEDHRLIAELLVLGKGYNIQEFLVKKYEFDGVGISSKISKYKRIYSLFVNRMFIFDKLNRKKISFVFLISLLSVISISIVYILRVNKELIRSLIK